VQSSFANEPTALKELWREFSRATFDLRASVILGFCSLRQKCLSRPRARGAGLAGLGNSTLSSARLRGERPAADLQRHVPDGRDEYSTSDATLYTVFGVLAARISPVIRRLGEITPSLAFLRLQAARSRAPVGPYFQQCPVQARPSARRQSQLRAGFPV
jgi:hypothetical protein